VRESVRIERRLYEEVFPKLPVSTLGFYGYAEEPDSNASWIFLEDAGQEAFSPSSEEHRACAVHWLALMHTSTWRGALPDFPPDRGPGYYLQDYLRPAVDNILKNRDNPVFSPEDRALLAGVVARLESVAAHRSEIETFCARFPKTLVHGDFTAKNLRIRRADNEITLLPLDWETAGYGVPAADVGKCPDTDAYWMLVRETWPHIKREDMQRFAVIGEIFHFIAAVNWVSWSLEFDWADQKIKTIKIYRSHLDALIHSAGLGS
jgi:hypothetical protein